MAKLSPKVQRAVDACVRAARLGYVPNPRGKLQREVVDFLSRQPRPNPKSETGKLMLDGLERYLSLTPTERAEDLSHAVFLGPAAMSLFAQYLGDGDMQVLEGYAYEGLTEVEQDHPEVFRRAARAIEKDQKGPARFVTTLPEEEWPSWTFFSAGRRHPKGGWLVHCTDADAASVIQDFRGVDDISRLGLTTYLSDRERENPGFGFGFEARSFPRYLRRGRCPYGDTLLLLKVPDYLVTNHSGDEEDQAIFWGPDIESGFEFSGARGYWTIEDQDAVTEDLGIEDPGEFDDLEDLLAWVERHPQVYREIAVENPRRRVSGVKATVRASMK